MSKKGTWMEVDLDTIRCNYKNIKSNLQDDIKICCVVKADAYSHGAVEVSKMLERENIELLAVARLEEALELRRGGICKDILCMGYICTDDIEEAIKNNIIFTVYSKDMAQEINKLASILNTIARVHIKIDTGMSRLGFLFEDSSVNDIEYINSLNNLTIEGIYTHFAKADEEDKKDTYLQLRKFSCIIQKLEANGIVIPIKHVSNTATILDMKNLGFNMVRLGIGLYGYYPSDEVKKDITLKPALVLKTKITNVKEVGENVGVSYSHSYITTKKTKIATLSVGYADGYSRVQKDAKVLVNGVLCSIIGKICMDQCMLEIPEDLNVKIEDEVILIGDFDGVRAEDLASRINSIPYEVLCSLSRRVGKYYIDREIRYEKSYID